MSCKADTLKLKLTLSAESLFLIIQWMDAFYGVHQYMKCHTGSLLSLGRGVILLKSTKQKIKSKNSTVADLVVTSKVLPQILWIRYFLEDQRVQVKECTLYQDNTSAIQIEKNGKTSSGQRTRHMNTRYFFIKDRVNSREATIIYCTTDDMVTSFLQSPYMASSLIDPETQSWG